MQNDEKLAEFFDVEEANELQEKITQELTVVESIEPTTIDGDLNLVRNNLKLLLETGEKAVKELSSLCEQSQSARAYEVLSDAINTLAVTNQRLLEVHKTAADSKKAKQDVGDAEMPARVINQNLFVGSTSELQKLIEDMKKQ